MVCIKVFLVEVNQARSLKDQVKLVMHLPLTLTNKAIASQDSNRTKFKP